MTEEALTGAQTIGARIRDRREKVQLTQGQLADKLGVSRVAITQWELSTTHPAKSRMAELAEALSCSVLWLTFGETLTMSRTEFETAIREAMQHGFDAAMAELSRLEKAKRRD